MTVNTTWVVPSVAATSGGLDIATGAILSEAWCDGVASDLLRLGGATGAVTQNTIGVFTSAISTVGATAYVTTGDSIGLTTTGTGDVIVFAFYTVQNTVAGNNCSLAIQQDAGGYGAYGSDVFSPSAGYNFSLMACTRFAVPSAASHTYNAGWRIVTGAGTLSNGTASRLILAIELKR